MRTRDGFGQENLTITAFNPQMQWVKARCEDGVEREFSVCELQEEDDGELDSALATVPIYRI